MPKSSDTSLGAASVSQAKPSSSDQKPELRVLQVFTSLGMGGAETWLISLLRYFKAKEADLPVRLTVDIVLTGGFKAHFDEEAVALGARLFYLPYSRRKIPSFVRGFRRLLRRGRYHAIHDHQDYTSGLHFLFGMGLLPPVRIVHVHNPLTTTEINLYSSSRLRRATGAAGKYGVIRFATDVVGTSRQLVTEYGFDDAAFKNIHLGAAYCGFDTSLYKGSGQRDDVRREFGWNESAKILLFVGRLDSNPDRKLNQKNPELALEVARNAIAQNPDVKLLMAGEGDTIKAELEERIKSWGMEDKILLVGVRSDVPRLMMGCDLLLFPSLAEGLGMVVVEAQAAGLPVLASDVVPRECVVSSEMVTFLSLQQDAPAWANEVLRLISLKTPSAIECNLAVRNSPFSIENSANTLLNLYRGGTKK